MAQELSEQTRALVRSRIKDYHSLTPEQQLREAIKVIAADFHIYCERNLMIQDKISGEIVPFKLNWAQKLLVKRVMDDIAHGRPVRYIILKARQMGLSTVIEALGFWWTTTHKNIKTVIIAHETEASGNLYNMFKRYFDNSHPTFQPRRKYNNKKELVFDVDDTIKEEYKAQGKPSPGLGSEIKTLVAKEGKGRSATIHFFHGSEVAFWEAKADVVSSAIQAVPLAANTFAFLESTANGVGGFFYDEWQFAKKNESAFKPLFFAWHEHSEYEMPGTVEVYDDEELELLEIFKEKGYPEDSWDRKILWRREKKKEFRSDPKKFYQEYPKDDMEAFLSSGRPVFEISELVKMEQIAQKAPAPMFGQILANPDTSSSIKFIFDEVPVNFQDQDPTPLKIWDLPEKGERYTIGVDVSEGKLNVESAEKKNDYSVIDVTRVSDLKTVARWRGHIDPDLLGAVVFALGTFYNTALVGVEINNHGLTTVQHLRNKFYRNLYMRETNEEHQFQERTALMGWRTDRKTKPIIINNLVQAIRDNDIIDLDVVFIRECMTYVRDDQGFTNAQEGMYDDTVMAKAIALQLTNFNSINAEYAKEHINKPIKRNKHATRSNELEEIARGTVRRTGNVEAVRRRREARAAHRRVGRRG
ncbi:terminase large subunit [Caudoviricetes sp.]|nr:terminase large subunit [Caudoviricetes sp.]